MIADCYCSHVAINSGDKRLLYPFLIILVINVLLYLYLYVKLLCILLEPCQGRRNSPTQLTHSLKTCTYIGLPSELIVCISNDEHCCVSKCSFETVACFCAL